MSKFPAPGALSRARALLLELAPAALAIPFDNWTSLACICDTGWLAASRRPVGTRPARIARRRLRVLASRPAAVRGLRGGCARARGRSTCAARCAALPGHDARGPLWRVEAHDDAADGRILIEEGHDFLLSVDGGGHVYVLSNGGHLVERRRRCARATRCRCSASPTRSRIAPGLAPAPHGRGGLLPAIRSGSELPLLVTHVVR